ncbi:hypothetical protein OHC33_008381 [Knufia fluminis]|uniref:Uncharacterized protein n=1 Tax=Knufia fluminis TaxID=191047 RepID=A0AAN8EFQ0_9EURO|nr:hypothetical protein OHC33_008381 [Knufia fluminis]
MSLRYVDIYAACIRYVQFLKHLGGERDYYSIPHSPPGLFERIGRTFDSTFASGYARVIQGDVNIGQLNINVRDMISPAFHFITSLLSGVTSRNPILQVSPEATWQFLDTFTLSAATLLLTVQHRSILHASLSFSSYFRRPPMAIAHAIGTPKPSVVFARHISRFARRLCTSIAKRSRGIDLKSFNAIPYHGFKMMGTLLTLPLGGSGLALRLSERLDQELERKDKAKQV